MIQFTIKTLDSRDHPFTVDDEITVQELKQKVMEEMGVDVSLQRLIFCGRVLQDDKKLAEYGVEGKVVHMVQRAPPSVEAREALRDRERERERENAFTSQPNVPPPEPISISPVHLNNFTQQQIRRLVALAASAQGIQIEELPGLDLSPTASRLEFLRRLIPEISAQVEALKQNESDEPPNYPDDDLEPPAGMLAEACALPNEVMCQIHQRPLIYQIEPPSGSTRQSRGRSIRAMRSSYHTPPADFAEIIEQLHNLDAEFAPFRELYIRTLREVNNPQIQLEEEELQRRQRTAEISAELYHSFSHAYHLVSDIGLLMTHDNSRLTSEALMRTPFPVQTHINVIQSSTTRRGPTNEGSSSSQATDAQPQSSQAQAAGRSQPTVNINVQPDPITYQVEIEARVPIPVNPDSQSPNPNPNPNASQNQSQSQSPSPSANQNQGNQDGQANRRQVMLDFENIFRGLPQLGSLGGVEVVMSMEEIPPAVAAQIPQQDVAAGGNQPLLGSQIYLAQMPWAGGPPTAELLQNMLSSVIRQGLFPGMEGILHAHLQQIPNPNVTGNQATNAASNQDTDEYQDNVYDENLVNHKIETEANLAQSGQGSGETGLGQAGATSHAGTSHAGTSQSGSGQGGESQANQGQSDQGQGSGQGGADGGGEGSNGVGQSGSGQGGSGQGGSGQGGSGQGGSGQGGSGQGGSGQGGSGEDGSEQGGSGQGQDDQSQPGQSQTPSSEQSQNEAGSAQSQAGQENGGSSDQANQEEPPRPQSVSLINLIYDRFLPCDSPHARRQLQRRREETLRAGGPRLRDSSTSRIQNNVETLFERFDRHTINEESLMIAAFLTLREATAFSSGRTLVPDELLSLRLRLQLHMREIMDYETGTQDQLAEMIFARHAVFIARMQLITPIRPSVDLVESMKAVVLRFLNEAMTVLEMENDEMFSRRFRIVYPRMFYELCGVVSYCCLEGIEGLRRIYRSYISDLIQNIDEPVRDLLYSLGMENLNTAISRIETNKVHCAQFIRRKGSSQGDSSEASEAAMDIGDSYALSQPEAMERSPDDIDAEFNPYPCDPRAETSTAGIVPTITTLVNPSTDVTSPAISPIPTITTAPIVPTVTTVPNVSTYQTPTTVQSVPIVPTAPIIPTVSMVPTATPVPAPPIVHTVPIVPTVSVVPVRPVVPTPLVSATPVLVPAPIIVPATPIVPAPAIVPTLPTIPAVPAVPTLPISPHYVDRSGASAMASNSRQSPSGAYPRDSVCYYYGWPLNVVRCYPPHYCPLHYSAPIYIATLPIHLHTYCYHVGGDNYDMMPEMPEQSDHDSSSDMSHRSRGRTSGRRPCPFVENYDDYWDGDQYRGRRTRYSAPSTSSAPVQDLYGFDDNMSESQASASASTSRHSRPHEPRGRYNTPRQSRPDRSYDSHHGRRNATSTVTSSRSDRSYEHRHNNGSGSSSSYRSDHSHHHTYRGYRGRRSHRGTNQPSSSGRMHIHRRLIQIYRNSHPGTSRGSRSDNHVNSNGQNNFIFNGRHSRHNHRNNHTNQNNHNNAASPSPPSPDDGSNLRFVPPAQIAQHWGEDWVPTFTRDLQRQSESSEPYSDAYLSGMPPKKRRCVRQSRPPNTLDGFIGESVGEISEQLTSHTELRAAFREQVRVLARARATASDEYEPRRYTATARFLRQPRPRKTAETPTSGTE